MNLAAIAQNLTNPYGHPAWDEYAQDEERAHKVAWSAVKNKYEKDEFSGQWKAMSG
jgi:cation transport regulator